MKKLIGLMDCNNFFVSCERLFRPDLAKKPVAVLSSNDGCIVARSQEVKDMGIPMGMPYFQVKDICKKEKITLFSSNFALYRDISSRVMTALKEEFDTVEVYSVDESFFTLDSSPSVNEMSTIRDRIMQKTGIPVSIGVAKTKTLAKFASTKAKKGSGVCLLSMEEWQKDAQTLSCGQIWGIGRKTTESLTQENINTVAQFLSLDHAYIAKKYGVVGERLWLELQGTLVYEIGGDEGHVPQTQTSTRSFGKTTTDKKVLQSAITYHMEHVARKLRSHRQVATQVTVIARGSRFGDFSHRVGSLTQNLLPPTNDTQTLIKEVLRLLDVLYDDEVPYKKAGVIASGLIPEAYVSESLFASIKGDDTSTLDSVIDALSDMYGRGIVTFGAHVQSNAWREKKQKISKQYTTRWSEIACVKAM